MCIAGSRRGSGESCYQELATDMQERQHSQMEDAEIELIKTNEIMMTLKNVVQAEERQSGEVVNNEEQNAVFVCISDSSLFRNSGAPITLLEVYDESSTKEATFRRLSGAEKLLLESLDIDQSRPRHIGRFLTMHKRRRKKLTTRSLNQEPGILDDIFHGLVQCVLQRAGNWRFNAFTLETVTGGRSLPVLCVHLFHWYGLFRHFSLDVVTVWKLFAFIEEGYHSTNPYHNSIHATDVTQAMHCFLQEKKIKTHLTNLEIMASLIAAVTHDLDHPGVNQPFLVATSNHLAALYQKSDREYKPMMSLPNQSSWEKMRNYVHRKSDKDEGYKPLIPPSQSSSRPWEKIQNNVHQNSSKREEYKPSVPPNQSSSRP